MEDSCEATKDSLETLLKTTKEILTFKQREFKEYVSECSIVTEKVKLSKKECDNELALIKAEQDASWERGNSTWESWNATNSTLLACQGTVPRKTEEYTNAQTTYWDEKLEDRLMCEADKGVIE